MYYHRDREELHCHYCGNNHPVPRKCPHCGSFTFSYGAAGTQKVEQMLQIKFPTAKVFRLDSDTGVKKSIYKMMHDRMKSKEIDILLGTQMISKGLDFYNVTLVIVLNGDSSLNIPDYRSAEKTFELLTQVAGRSGRSNKEGIALIQTYNPNHYSIELAKKHDYIGFYNEEIKIRKKLNYPPFCFIVSVRLLTNDYELGNAEINKVNKYLKTHLDNNFTVLGPTVSLKINNIYKFQCIIKYKDKEKIYEVLNNINKHYKNNKIKLEIDFNPIKI